MSDEAATLPKKKFDRGSIRSAIFATRPKSIEIELFGTTIELRQPSMGTMFKAQQGASTAHSAAQMLMAYAYVPGTDEKVFDEADIDEVINLPWGNDLVKVQSAIAELTGINKESLMAAVGNSDDSQEE